MQARRRRRWTHTRTETPIIDTAEEEGGGDGTETPSLLVPPLRRQRGCDGYAID